MPTKKQRNKWTIVFLVYAELRASAKSLQEFSGSPQGQEKDKILRELKSLYNDIVNSPHHELVDILVIYNRVIINQGLGKNDLTYLLRAVPDASNKEGRKRLNIVRRFETNNMSQKPHALKDAFKIIYDKFFAEQWLLFTWDHGSIFGIFRESSQDFVPPIVHTIKYEQIQTSLNDTVWVLRNKPYQRDWDTSSKPIIHRMPQCTNRPGQEPPEPDERDILTNEELMTVIHDWLPNKKLDVLIMMNCYMQNINTAYTLKNCVKYLVAPQGIINEPGYNYTSILGKIYESPGVKPKLIAKKAVTSLKELFTNSVFKKNINEWAIFAIHLKEYYLILDIVNDVSLRFIDLLKEDPGFRDIVHDARLRFFPFDNGVSLFMVDLRNCLLKINKKVNDPVLDHLLAKLQKLLKKITVEKFEGKELYISDPQLNYPDNYSPCGIAIYFPKRRSELNSPVFQTFIAENAPSRSLFFAQSQWLNFICTYHFPQL